MEQTYPPRLKFNHEPGLFAQVWTLEYCSLADTGLYRFSTTPVDYHSFIQAAKTKSNIK